MPVNLRDNSGMSFAPPAPPPQMTRPTTQRWWALVGGVALAHALLLWGVHANLELPPPVTERVTVMVASVLPLTATVPASQPGQARPVATVPATAVPVEAASTPPKAKPPPATPTSPLPQITARAPEPVLASPSSAAPVSPQSATLAPGGSVATSPSTQADATTAKSAAAATATSAGHAPALSGNAGGSVELPSSDASYLQNPRPEYPRISRQRGEQGRVLVRVLIGVDGSAQKSEIGQSSGFTRLDQAALSAVSNWRFVPGKRGGVAEAMWFTVPVGFCLSADGVQCQP